MYCLALSELLAEREPGAIMELALIIGSIASGGSGSSTVRQVQLMVILLSVTLVVSLVSRRLRLPYTLVLVMAGLAIGLTPLVQGPQLDPNLVLFLFLPALLFEGAWNAEIGELAADWLPIFLLAVPGLLIALAFLAVVLHLAVGLSWLVAILVGAIVSPTDPIAALALLRQLGLSERLRAVVDGESLFNDGVGVAVFEVTLQLLLPSLGLATLTGAFKGVSLLNLDVEILWLLLGGPIIGTLFGWLVAQLLSLVDDHLFEITVTFSAAYGGYLLGDVLHTSGLLTVVCAGLVIGSYGRSRHMSQHTQQAATDVWEFIGYLANSLLFLLLGIQIGNANLLRSLPSIFWAFLGIIIGRALIIYTLLPLHDLLARRLARRPARRATHPLPRPRPLPSSWRPLLILIGLRGALSIALVLSLPTNFAQRGHLESIVYGVVLITLLGQGLGLRFLLPHWSSVREETPTPQT
jgi:CPA1 family monovalent cation:H+ antiporter